MSLSLVPCSFWGSLSKGVPRQRRPWTETPRTEAPWYGKERAVRILLECILVDNFMFIQIWKKVAIFRTTNGHCIATARQRSCGNRSSCFLSCLSVILSTREGGSHVTIAHDALDLTIQGSPLPEIGPHLTAPPGHEYSLDRDPQLVTSGGYITGDLFKLVHPTGADIWKLLKHVRECFLVDYYFCRRKILRTQRTSTGR